MKFTQEDMRILLESEVGLYQPKRKACKKCDHYGSVKHAGLTCTKCGGEMVDVSKWTVGNLLERSKQHARDITCWLPTFAAHYIHNKDGGDLFDALQLTSPRIDELRDLYSAELTKKGPQ